MQPAAFAPKTAEERILGTCSLCPLKSEYVQLEPSWSPGVDLLYDQTENVTVFYCLLGLPIFYLYLQASNQTPTVVNQYSTNIQLSTQSVFVQAGQRGLMQHEFSRLCIHMRTRFLYSPSMQSRGWTCH